MAQNDTTVYPEIVTFGETMALFTPVSRKGILYSPQMEKSYGGAESNVAIGVARLGHRAGWCGCLGNDPLGVGIWKSLRAEGVDVTRAKLVNTAGTGIMMREIVFGKSSVYYYRKASAASRMNPADLNEDYIQHASILHITGITPALSESCKETVFHAVQLAKKHGVKVSFDPNLRLKLWSLDEAREVITALANQADYFLSGFDELKLIYDTDDWQQILDELRSLPGVSVIKGKGDASAVFENGKLMEVPYFPVKSVIDPVGAGDGFCAGFLTGVLKGYSTVEAVKLGNLVGSLVVQVEGDWEALPTWDAAVAIRDNLKHIER